MNDATDAASAVDQMHETGGPFAASPTDAPQVPTEFDRLAGGVSLTECVSQDKIALAAHPNPEAQSAVDTSARVRLTMGENGELIGRSSRSELPDAAAHETELVRRAEALALANGQSGLTFEAPSFGHEEPRIAEWEARGYAVTRDGAVLRASKENLAENPIAPLDTPPEQAAVGGSAFDAALLPEELGRFPEAVKPAEVGRLDDGTIVTRTASEGYSFVPPGDGAAYLADQLRPIDGWFDVMAHGGPDAVDVTRDGITQGVSAKEFADSIRQLPGWDSRPIRLLSCQTGLHENGFAQQLSDELGVEVAAPPHSITVDAFGVVRYGESNSVEAWSFFEPRRHS